jgi:hypothetical protein
VLLQKSDRLVTIGIADAGFHGSLCRISWLVLRRLGGLRLGRGRLTHNPQYPRPDERRSSRPASPGTSAEADLNCGSGNRAVLRRM